MSSQNLQNTSKTESVQLPLKGFMVEVQSEKTGWRKFIEGMGDGRFRVHSTKKR